MANRLQHLRGSEAEHSTFTGAKGEISLVTDTSADRIPTGEVRVHDGTTAGGLPLALGTTSKPLTNNIVLGSGVGINFNNYGSEDSNSATTVGNNLLDDYEEGSWTPSADVAPSGTITTIIGEYVKVGRVVYVHLDIIGTTLAISSYAQFTGLPFTVTATGSGYFTTESISANNGGEITISGTSFYLGSVSSCTRIVATVFYFTNS